MALKMEENVEELVNMQETDKQRMLEVKKYFDKVDKENEPEENEFNRTTITEHHLVKNRKKKINQDTFNDQLRVY